MVRRSGCLAVAALSCIKDGKLIKVEGDEAIPLCRDGFAPGPALTHAYHPNRLQRPLKESVRGAREMGGNFLEEALDEVEYNMNKIRKEYGPEAMVFGRVQAVMPAAPHSLPMPTNPNWTLFGFPAFLFTPVSRACIWFGDIARGCCPVLPCYDDPDFVVPELKISMSRGMRGSQCADHYFTSHWVIDI